MYRKFFKRAFDLAIGLTAVVITMPIMVLIAVVLLFANNGKPFFFQRRPGMNGKLFLLYKFRTMNEKMNDEGLLLPDEKRLTAIGKFIRNTSLDELPQLFNVLKGDMSLVGPRPLLKEYLPLYTPFQERRHEVRPGITGWAQVNGRNAIGWDQKFNLDVWYVDHINAALDAKILWKTARKMFNTEGISQQGHATMPHFKGMNQS